MGRLGFWKCWAKLQTHEKPHTCSFFQWYFVSSLLVSAENLQIICLIDVEHRRLQNSIWFKWKDTGFSKRISIQSIKNVCVLYWKPEMFIPRGYWNIGITQDGSALGTILWSLWKCALRNFWFFEKNYLPSCFMTLAPDALFLSHFCMSSVVSSCNRLATMKQLKVKMSKHILSSDISFRDSCIRDWSEAEIARSPWNHSYVDKM